VRVGGIDIEGEKDWRKFKNVWTMKEENLFYEIFK